MTILINSQVSDQVHGEAQCEGSEYSSNGFTVIPIEDRRLVRKHGGLGLQDYWLDCWEADPYGSRYVLMPDSDLKSSTRRKYRKQLKDLGLFLFELRQNGNHYQLWILNRHGSRINQRLRSGVTKKSRSVDRIEGDAQLVERGVQTIEGSDQSVTRGDRIVEVSPTNLSGQDFQKPSISFQYLFNNFSTNNTNIDVVAEKNVDELESNHYSLASLPSTPEPLVEPIDLGKATCLAADDDETDETDEEETKPSSPEETKEVLRKLRDLGIILNPTIQKVVRDYFANVELAIAHIKERVSSGEQFKNLAGAFVQAAKTGAKPQKPIGPSVPLETNPPTLEQLAALEEAKSKGAIADYYFSGDGTTKVVLPGGFHQMPWWEYLQ